MQSPSLVSANYYGTQFFAKFPVRKQKTINPIPDLGTAS
jgi:hypothetical protein